MSSPAVITCAKCSTRNRVPSTTTGTPHCASCHAPLPWIVEATGADFDLATTTRTPVLVDLWAPWCGPCRTISPLIEQTGIDLAGKLKVVKVNVDNAPEVSRRFGVQGIPTLLMLREGREVGRQVGALGAHALRAWIDTELAATSS